MTVRLLCLAPNPAIDRLIEVDRLVAGTIHRPSTVRAVAGGKGLNVARAAVTLGADVTAVALLGGHAGRWIADQLAGAGVVARIAWADAETRVATSIADRAERRLTELYEPGETVAPAAWTAFLELVETAVGDAAMRPAFVTMSGSLPPGAPVDGLARICDLAALVGLAAVVDSHGPPLAAAVAARPAIVKLNGGEAAGLLGIAEPAEPAAAAAAAESIVRLGPAGAVVTVGRRGAGAALDGEIWRVGPAPVSGRYPVASGDVLTAGLVVGLAEGRPVPEALRFAAAAAAANALMPGAAVFDRAAVAALGERIEVERAGRIGSRRLRPADA